ncbi:hypothetical protein [Mesorhizobium sp. M1B.F.Ca.ET.045.04.1.1]|uniref:hypothetical protein n=1 Tax=Mesorhizobium sp. M1B.F.Ca.ET.045.04.1.1 TaxID=2493673 RepID=UPI000F7526EA|nr:hypothetical protein [Mesorhizobium sp. M1B.F.Ca.ET.045.04.1.1]AZO29363.1 hypothetical protein EJ071_19550 [Mesorhizobium sp. M1B.F.Ca.ET.045.04.1.1]
MSAPSTDEVLKRLEILHKKLEDEGMYVRANTALLAIKEIKLLLALAERQHDLAEERQREVVSLMRQVEAERERSARWMPTPIERQPVEVKGEPYQPTGDSGGLRPPHHMSRAREFLGFLALVALMAGVLALVVIFDLPLPH